MVSACAARLRLTLATVAADPGGEREAALEGLGLIVLKGRVVTAKGLAEQHEFPGLQAFGRFEARRETDGKVQTETRVFALSWMPAPEVFMATARAHWRIGNALHWQFDVSFREDAARNRKDHGPANIAILRRCALDLARRDTSKGSPSIKLKRAGWNDASLLSLLNRLANT